MNGLLIALNILALTVVIGLSLYETAPAQVAQVQHSPAMAARQAVMGSAPSNTLSVSTERLSF